MLLQIIYGIVIWVIVPGIIFAILLLSMIIVARVKEPDSKVSARAGVWSGLVFFVIFVASQLPMLHEPDFSFHNLPGFDLTSTIFGFILGLSFLRILKLLKSTRLIGLITLTLSAASSIALFSYFFTASIRGVALFLATGTLFGILFHIVLFPKSVRVLSGTAPPTLSATPTFLDAKNNCVYFQDKSSGNCYWKGVVVLSNSRNAWDDLRWFAGSDGIPDIIIIPSSGSLAPEENVEVKIYVPDIGSKVAPLLTFSCPENRVNVTWTF